MDLKPCPFCGGEPTMLFSHEAGRFDCYIVECDPCGYDLEGEYGATAADAKQKAADRWNRRAQG